jgi:hypothetical protein
MDKGRCSISRETHPLLCLTELCSGNDFTSSCMFEAWLYTDTKIIIKDKNGLLKHVGPLEPSGNYMSQLS